MQGKFKGRSTVQQLADETLRDGWESASPQQVTEAMAKFRSNNQEAAT